MTELELDRMCEAQYECSLNCMACELFAYYMKHKED